MNSVDLSLTGWFRAVAIMALCSAVALADGTEQGKYDFAGQLARDGLYELAAQEFQRFVENHPNSSLAPDAQLEKARAHAKGGAFARAAEAFQGFLVKYPRDVRISEIWFKVGENRSKAGQHVDAARSYRELAETYPNSDFADRALLRAAEAHNSAGQPERTDRLLFTLIERYRNSSVLPRARYLLASERWRKGDADSALRLCEAVLGGRNRSSDAADCLTLAVEIHLVRSEVDRVEYYTDRMVSWFPGDRRTWEARIAVASWHQSQANRGGGEESLNNAAKLLREAYRRSVDQQQASRALFALANIREEQGAANMAESNWYTFLEMYPSSPERARALVGLGRARIAGGKEQEGVFTLEEVLSSSDTLQMFGALETLAEHYIARQDPATGAAYLRRLVALAPETRLLRRANYRLAAVYATHLGERERAMELFGQIAQGEDDIAAKAQFALAAELGRQGRVDDAENAYWRVRRRFPEHELTPAATDSITYIRLFLTKDHQGATEDLTAVVRALYGPDRTKAEAQAPLTLATITVERLKDYQAAIVLLSRYLVTDGITRGDEAEHKLAQCHLYLATKARLKHDSEAENQHRQMALLALGRLADNYPNSELADDAYIETADARLTAVATEDRAGETIKAYDEFLNRFPETDRKGYAWVRLAESYLEISTTSTASLNEAWRWSSLVLEKAPRNSASDRALYVAAESARRQGETDDAKSLYQRLIAERPFSAHVPEGRLQLSGIYAREGKHRLAARELEKLLRLDDLPRPRQTIQRRLIEAWEAVGDFKKSGSVAERMTSGDLASPWGARHWARALVAQGSHGQADAVLAQELAARPNAEDADSLAIVRARAQTAAGRQREALRMLIGFERMFPLSERTAEVWSLIAKVSFDLESYSAALGHFRKVLNVKSDNRDARLGVLTTLYRLGRTGEAVALRADLERALTFSPDEVVRLSYEEGQAMWRNKRYQEAIDQFQRVVDESPNSAWADDALYAQGMCAASSGRAEIAVRAFEGLLRDYRQSRLYVRSALELGNAYFGAGYYEFAADAYYRVLEASADDSLAVEATWNSLLAYEKAERLDAANRFAQQLIDRYPDHKHAARAKVKIGLNLSTHGDYAGAIAQLESLIEEVDGIDEAEVRITLGEAYYNQGRYQEAIVEWLKLAYFNLGQGAETSEDEFRMMAQWRATARWRAAAAYDKWGKTEQACRLYQQMVTQYGATSDWGRAAAQRMGALCQPATSSAAKNQ